MQTRHDCHDRRERYDSQAHDHDHDQVMPIHEGPRMHIRPRSGDVSSQAMHNRTAAQPHSRTSAQPHSSTAALAQHTQGSYSTYSTGRATDSEFDVGPSVHAADTGSAPEADYDKPAASRYPCAVRQQDLRELAAQPGDRRWRSSYRTFIGGDQPRNVAPGDTQTAAMMVRRLQEARAHGGYSRNERNRLSRMLRVWRARAEGRDPRFLIAGTRPGRLSYPEAGRVAELRRVVGMETWDGPTERTHEPTTQDRVLA